MMLINDEIQKQLLQLFAKSSNLPKVEAEQQSASQLQLTPGQQVQAEVVAKLPNHLFLARIAGELFKMELPLNVQPGETMHMTFVSAEPRITFELARADNGKVPVTISTTGKWLSSLMNSVIAQESSSSQSLSPILNGPPTDTELFAVRLKEAMTLGGLFYESHLAEWARGDRQIAQLLVEPQGKLSRRLVNPDPDLLQKGNEGNGILPKSIAEEATASKPAAGFIADPQTLPIIKDQLATLNSGVLIWNGQAWPEQKVEISVREREADGSSPQEREWETSLRLQLPALGEISATLHLSGAGLNIVLQTDDARTAAILLKGLPVLKERVDEAGINLTEMVIKR
ncbi:flagellar hook-length control protein FliK [Geotalea daltonii]|nr:flagellar hook-length control protein FliK [Geotalea daltonii]